MSNNPTETTDEYLEFLAGRRKQPPVFSDSDRDVLDAANALRSLRHSPEPSPHFSSSLKKVVMRTPDESYAPKRSDTRAKKSRGFLPNVFKFGIPAVVIAGVLVAIAIVPDDFFTKFFHRTPLSSYIAQEAKAATITLEATKGDTLGVEAGTTFTLKAEEGTVTAEDVKSNFKLTPDVAYSVKEKGKNSFEIVPEKALSEKTVYTASYEGYAKTDNGAPSPRTYSWAYQVRNAFQIIGTLPRNKATSVAQETGIEVTFSSSGVSAKDFEKKLDISPKTDGRVEVHNRTLVFVPAKKLKEKSVYTVTVKKGLTPQGASEGLAEDFVFQFEVMGKSKDQDTGYSRIVPRNVFESIRPNEPIVFAEYSFPSAYNEKDDTRTPKSYEFTVYQYKDLNAFLAALEEYQQDVVPWSMYANEGTLYETKGLTKVGTFKTKAENGVITLGTSFSEGFYLADSTSNDTHSQIPFLASPIGAYAVATQTDTLVWVNDLVSSAPVSGASIALRNSSVTAQTDEKGIATFTTPDDIRQNQTGVIFATVRANDKDTVILAKGNSYNWYGGNASMYGDSLKLTYAPEKYWSYLSTDRSLYLPNDTIRFWGVLKRRDNPKTSEKVTIRLIQTNYEGRYSADVLKTLELSTNQTGTYIGSIDLNDVSTVGYPEIVVSVGDEWVTSKSVSVETYKKPPYQITVKPDRYAVFAGETANITVTTTFFDGTPVSNVGLRFEQNYGVSKPDFSTDSNGKAVYTKTFERMGDHTSTSDISVVPFEQYEGDIRGSNQVMVYPARFQIESEGTVQGAKAEVSGTVRNLHPELADPTADDPFSKVVGEVRPNQTIEGKLYATITEEIPDGTYYDFLSKKVVERFRYETREELRETFNVTTDRNGTFSKTLTVDPKLFYHVDLSGVDEKGDTARDTAYIWSRGEYYYSSVYGGEGGSSVPNLSLVDLNAVSNQSNPSYVPGDTVKLQVNRGNSAVSKDLAQKILFISSQRGLRNFTVKDSPTYSFKFSDSDIPMLYTRAVVFTGVGFAELYGPTIEFDKTTRALKIEIVPDHETYGPGDTAKLDVRVTDKDGNGQRARVNLSAVDEAIIALQGQRYDDPLAMLYRWVSEGVISTYASHKEALTSDVGAERGGGGGDRIDFRDNALYTEIETDASGNGTVSYKLPDNLTSWRITAQAVTDDLKAGLDDRVVSVQKPLFVVTSFSDRVLSRDKQKLAATAYGSDLSAGDAVDFSFSIVDMPGTEATVRGKAFESVSIDIPKLDVGDYKVRVSITAKDQNDAVVEPLHVLGSNLMQRTVKTAYLEKAETPVFAASGRTQLRIGDADRNLAYDLLWGLLWSPYSRLDDTVAARIASNALESEFKDQPWTSPGDPSVFMTEKGLALYAIGSEDLEYGALAAADPAFIDNAGKLVRWFRRTIDDPKSNTEQVAYALYGLAQLKEPVLNEIKTLLKVEGLPDRDQLTLALALETLGAKEEARPIARLILDRYSQTQDEYVRLKLGANDDEKIVNTARFAILAASLALNERYGLIKYVVANPPKDTSTHLEEALAIVRLLKNASAGTVSVTYTLNGASETKQLGKKDALTLSLSVDEAKTFSVTAHTGNVSVVSTYSEPFDSSKAARDANLSISRKYSVSGKATTKFKKGDLVKIEFTWSKKSGALGKQFGLVDLLPAGLRVVSNPWLFDRSDHVYYPYSVEYNRAKFYAGDNIFYYYARAVVAGTVIAEPVTIQAFDAPSNVQYSSEAPLVIE
ncbi:MAG: alpha-2-macroglobulin family protein [Candidatus Kerfeldbacteria bacterium]